MSGGGYVKVNSSPVTGTSFTDTGLRNAQNYFYVVTALDAWGNESAYSNEVSAMPHYTIGWANLQWPPTMTHTISVIDRTDNAYGQVWIDGVTEPTWPDPNFTCTARFWPQRQQPGWQPSVDLGGCQLQC